MFDNPTLCASCGGKCCKQAPGVCYPEDFGLPGSSDRLLEALKSGRYCIDWWEGNPLDDGVDRDQAYFIRPVYKGEEGRLFHGGWGGECTFLTSIGCRLASDARPKECQHLRPTEDEEEECDITNGVGKHDAVIAWLPYKDLIDSLAAQVETNEPSLETAF